MSSSETEVNFNVGLTCFGIQIDHKRDRNRATSEVRPSCQWSSARRVSTRAARHQKSGSKYHDAAEPCRQRHRLVE